jgi:hypothetical protein
MLNHDLIMLSNRLQYCLDLFPPKEHLKSIFQTKQGVSSFLGANIAGVEYYKKIPECIWKDAEPDDTESDVITSTEQIEERFHEMFGPLMTDAYFLDIDELLQRIIDTHKDHSIQEDPWFTCSAVRLKVSTGEHGNEIIFQTIFMRPRTQGKNFLKRIIEYMAANIPGNCTFKICTNKEMYSDEIDSDCQGTDNTVFDKTEDADGGIQYTMKNKSLYLSNINPRRSGEMMVYPDATVLNENVQNTRNHSRPYWARVAATIQKYKLSMGMPILKMHFKAESEYDLEILQEMCKILHARLKDRESLYTHVPNQEREIFKEDLRHLAWDVFLVKDIYARDYEKLDAYQESIRPLTLINYKFNVFLSFFERMHQDEHLYPCRRHIKFASFQRYKRLIDILTQIKEIIDIKTFALFEASLFTYPDIAIQLIPLARMDQLKSELTILNIVDGFEALTKCTFHGKTFSFSIESNADNTSTNPDIPVTRKQKREEGNGAQPISPRVVKFSWASELNPEIEDFKKHIPNVIKALKALTEY